MRASVGLCLTEKRKAFMALGDIDGKHDISALTLLRRVAARISETAPLEEVLGEVVEFVATAVSSDSCFIYVLEAGELVLGACKSRHAEAVEGWKWKLRQGITDWFREHQEPAIIPRRAGSDPRFNSFHEFPENRFEGFLSVPMVSRGRLAGVILVENRDGSLYGDPEIELVSAIGFLVGREIQMARLEQHNAELSERLESRTLVERAKGILQRDLGIGESEAYQKLQRQSQQMRKPMKEIAEAIVLSHAIKTGCR